MMWWHGDWNGWAWLAMSASMLLFWGLLIWGVMSVVRNTSNGSRPTPRESDPDQILRERFARGEIDEEEYERRRDLLRR